MNNRQHNSRRNSASWADYELAKADWQRLNPGASPEQYQRAMQAICRRLGL